MSLALGTGCASSAPSAVATEAAPTRLNVDVAELEIHREGIDRFVHCPPAGELGQQWFPAIAPWRAKEVSTAEKADRRMMPLSGSEDSRAHQLRTEQAILATHPQFRNCYHRGLLVDPVQEGRVAMVIRVGEDGRVAKTEVYGACDLASETLACMKTVAGSLKFVPPESGADTLLIPAVFANTNGRTFSTPVDAYTADAYVVLETAREALHVCEGGAGTERFATSATFVLDVDVSGAVKHAHMDSWRGDRDLLTCSAKVLSSLRFPAPSLGAASITTRLIFNPRR